jgi:endonuclease/exonuclease/phosphatase family metal-dependent hydrolase
MNIQPTSSRLSVFSAPPGAPTSPAAAPGETSEESALQDTFQARTAEAPEARPSSGWKRKVLSTALAGLALAGVAGGVAGTVMVQAPICPGQTSPLSISREGVCVSPRAANDAATAWRQIRGTAHTTQTVQDLASDQSRVLQPDGTFKPAELPAEGGLRVVSWNLHHAQSPNQDGSRDQSALMLREINDQQAPVVLLQEVPPWHAQSLVDGTGMVGYYAQTTSTQGNLVLVHPDLQVAGQAKSILNSEIDGLADAVGHLGRYGGQEPRQVQAVHLVLPDGRQVMVWNTHLSTDAATSSDRAAEQVRLVDFLDAQARPGEAILGGGDLNNRLQDPAPQRLLERGFDVQGASIDFLASRGVEGLQTGHATLRNQAGQRISDHPMVWGEIP